MDSKTIKQLCTENLILADYFCGIERWDALLKTSLRLVKKGSFIFINYENSHWFLVQKLNKNGVALFDSFGGKYLPSRRILCKYFRKIMNSVSPIKIFYIIPKNKKIQKNTSLTCGEHCIIFAMESCSVLIKSGNVDKGYYKKILIKSEKLNENPDIFVWRMVYEELKLIKKPNLANVLIWYDKFLEK